MLLNEESEGNYRITIDAVQTSVNQVSMRSWIPESGMFDCSDRLHTICRRTRENNFPMFQVNDGKLLRRADLVNLSDPTTKNKWNSLKTTELSTGVVAFYRVRSVIRIEVLCTIKSLSNV